MSTGAIIAIAVGVIVIIALLAVVFSPKRREEKRLREERGHAADRHRELASERHQHASVADQKAQEAQLKAERAQHEADLARREAESHEGRADLHDQGLADHELDSGPDARPAAETEHTSPQDSNGRYTAEPAPDRTTPPRR